MKEVIQSVLWVSELEAVDLGTMRKDNLGST